MSRKRLILTSIGVATVVGAITVGMISVNGRDLNGGGKDDAQIAAQSAAPSRLERRETVGSIDPPENTVPATRQGDQSEPLHDFKMIKSCMLSVQDAVDMASQIEACQSFPEDDPATADCRERTKDFDDEIDIALSRSRECPSNDLATLENEFFLQTRDAAKAGDTDAQLCYLGMQLELNRNWTDTEVEEFKELSPRFAGEAFQRGDWRIVALMMTSTRVLSHTDGPLRYLVDDDPVSVYRMNRLARLGAVGEYADELDVIALDPENMLPPGTEIESDRWAEKMYNDHFRRSPQLHQAPAACKI